MNQESDNNGIMESLSTQTEQLSILETPLGQRDSRPKIQICLEIRKKEIGKKRKKVHIFLEVTVIWVKNLPKSTSRDPNPIVKLWISPGDIIYTTDIKKDRCEAQYIETFEFPIENDTLQGYNLEVKVCDRKLTRNAKSFGNVTIQLDKFKVGKPVIKWHNLKD